MLSLSNANKKSSLSLSFPQSFALLSCCSVRNSCQWPLHFCSNSFRPIRRNDNCGLSSLFGFILFLFLVLGSFGQHFSGPLLLCVGQSLPMEHSSNNWSRFGLVSGLEMRGKDERVGSHSHREKIWV